ncbi:unnamed protein product [Effrenium voratum]|uniref:RING-CH-type domain-containing protein n=1 Tax=Effrenium voratum TaxID=2562239 RepID=A0AA36J7Q1_9DINO|nr:unnamed protein product [Effrenium voratum]
MEERSCRVCHGAEEELLEPCVCAGSVRWIHRRCLNQWQQQCLSSGTLGTFRCELCGFVYVHEMGIQSRYCAVLTEVSEVLLCCTPLVIIILLIGVTTDLAVGLTAAGAILGLGAACDLAASLVGRGAFSACWQLSSGALRTRRFAPLRAERSSEDAWCLPRRYLLFSLPLMLPNVITFFLFTLRGVLGVDGLTQCGVLLSCFGCIYALGVILLKLCLAMLRNEAMAGWRISIKSH